MKTILLIAALLFAAPLHAQEFLAKGSASVTIVPDTVPVDCAPPLMIQVEGKCVTVAYVPPPLPLRMSQIDSQPKAGPPTATTTVTTSGPVTTDTKVSVGTWAGEVLQWAAVAFGTVISTALTAWLVKLLQLTGVQVTAQMKQQLQGVVVNGINAAAARAKTELAGLDPITIRNQIVADTVTYVQSHGDELIKKLGLDPKSGEAVEAIRARIETAIVDPATPTATVPPLPVVARTLDEPTQRTF